MHEDQQSHSSCMNGFKIMLKQLCVNVAQFFQCDQHFEPLEIVPYQIHLIKDHNPLLPSLGMKNHEENQVVQDNMLLEHDQSSRWGQLGSCKWWREWFCCLSEQNNWLDEGTHYDLYERKSIDEDKDQRFFSNNTLDNMDQHENNDGINEKDEIVFLAEELSVDGGKNRQQISNAELNDPSYVHLKPIEQRVNPKEKEVVGSIGVKRRNRRQFKDTAIPKHTNENNQADSSKLAQQIQELQNQPTNGGDKNVNKRSEIRQNVKTDNNLRRANQNINTKINSSVSQNQQKSTSHQPSNSHPPHKSQRQKIAQNQFMKNENGINARDDFNQLGEALEQSQSKPMVHSKTTFIPPKLTFSKFQNQDSTDLEKNNLLKINQSEIMFPTPPKFFKNQSTLSNNHQQSFENNQDMLDDGMRKRKKKTRNLFNQQITPIGDIQVTEESAPEDLTKKKRRRRRKTIMNQQKQQQQRAQRRRNEEKGREELQIILYSEDEENDN